MAPAAEKVAKFGGRGKGAVQGPKSQVSSLKFKVPRSIVESPRTKDHGPRISDAREQGPRRKSEPFGVVGVLTGRMNSGTFTKTMKTLCLGLVMAGSVVAEAGRADINPAPLYFPAFLGAPGAVSDSDGT